jgi:hypothetical protein
MLLPISAVETASAERRAPVGWGAPSPRLWLACLVIASGVVACGGLTTQPSAVDAGSDATKAVPDGGVEAGAMDAATSRDSAPEDAGLGDADAAAEVDGACRRDGGGFEGECCVNQGDFSRNPLEDQTCCIGHVCLTCSMR